jgi:hypothetical protein
LTLQLDCRVLPAISYPGEDHEQWHRGEGGDHQQLVVNVGDHLHLTGNHGIERCASGLGPRVEFVQRCEAAKSNRIGCVFMLVGPT